MLGLMVLTALFRRELPTDGLFYDDAWQALGAVKGSLSQLALTGQTQPAFTLELTAWSRLVGSGDTSLVVPTLIAGVLGPPLLYLVLRRVGAARSIAALLGTAMAVAPVHIIYSTRVKSYTTDVLIMLGLTLLVPLLARRPWRRSTALAWFVGAVAIASFSSFALLAAAAAGILLVLHPQPGDRRLRIVTVAAQMVAHLAFLVAVSRQYNADLVTRFFEGKDGFIDRTFNPITLTQDVVTHLLRVVFVYPAVDGPTWWLSAVLVAAVAGLAAMAWRGPHRVAARFLGLSALIAMAGSFAGMSPFGPRSDPPISGGGRVTLWLIPALAVGLAATLTWARRASGDRVGLRRAFDGVALGLAVLLVVGAVGEGRPYPLAGARDGTRHVMERLEDDDVVLITRPTSFSFALYADTPVDLAATPKRAIGFLPDFEDPRFTVLPDFNVDVPALQATVADADRVWVVHADVDPRAPAYAEQRLTIAIVLDASGFTNDESVRLGQTVVDLWRSGGPEG
ncbi:MAG: glycosyltransferase family 39 protein [Acidimicrobiales bacterium]